MREHKPFINGFPEKGVGCERDHQISKHISSKITLGVVGGNVEINQWIGTIYLLVGVLFTAYGLILVLKKLPKNNLVGFRMKKAMESDENWYDINFHGGKRLMQTSISLIVVGFLSLLIEYDTGDLIFWFFLLSPLLVVFALVDTHLHAGRL